MYKALRVRVLCRQVPIQIPIVGARMGNDSGKPSDSDSDSVCLTMHVRIVVAGSQTVGVRRFTGIISSFWRRLSESESEPESVCTIRVPSRYTKNIQVRQFGNMALI